MRHFRKKLTRSGALRCVMKAFDWQLRKKGYVPISGQIVDASLVPAPVRRGEQQQGRGAQGLERPERLASGEAGHRTEGVGLGQFDQRG